MGMRENVARQWKIVEVCLKNCGIYCSLHVDVLTWKYIKGVSQVRVKDIYLKLITSGNANPNSFFLYLSGNWVACPNLFFLVASIPQ